VTRTLLRRAIRRHSRYNVGDAVTNVIPGNPGPQAAFNPRLPNYQAVVPYFGKIE